MLSRMVPRLEKAGLLRRREDPADKRVTLVEATTDASKLLEQVRSERDDVLAKLLEELDDAERQALATATPALDKLADRLREQASGGRLKR